MNDIALLTTSRGRLHHLQQSLPLMLSQGAAEVVVVDYGCPDGTADWVERHHPTVRVVRVTDDTEFCLARARNTAAAHSRADWLVFVDADILISPGWVDWMRRHLVPGHFYRAAPIDGRRVPDTRGTVICTRDAFDALDGYDEMFRGWGGEDDDLYHRLAQQGVVQDIYPSAFVSAIAHDDSQRAGWGALKSREQQLVLHQCYGAAKEQFATLFGTAGRLVPEVRQTLMDTSTAALAAWYAGGARDRLVIQHVLRRNGKLWMPPGYGISTEVTFTIHVDHAVAPTRDDRAEPALVVASGLDVVS